MNYITPGKLTVSPNLMDTKEGTLTTFLALNLASFFAICTFTACRSNLVMFDVLLAAMFVEGPEGQMGNLPDFNFCFGWH